VRLRRGVTLGAAATAAVGGAWLVERSGRRRFTSPPGAPVPPGRQMPADLRQHIVPMSDGGAISVLERGRGPALVLVHGICLGVSIWAPQFAALGDDHRVVAISQRGHDSSVAGRDGYSIERLATDLVEVLEALDITDATLAGHSLGGMVALAAALDQGVGPRLARRVRRLVLVATTAGPTLPVAGATAALAVSSWSLARSQRRQRAILPAALSAWGARASFGAAPRVSDVQLVDGLLRAMSPEALAGLLPSWAPFDVRDQLDRVALDARVVAGSRDLITPPRTARALVAGIPGTAVEWLDGCGHMVMLEREEELCRILA
jgi:pimeloyl-ACP methyl ester carboxylesterase